ncbi:MAG: sarcosine oxidase subunit delta [Azospirillum sp.]|nr:sarcosine oxidase subunit delta [Azospirillum sp.]
MRINCPHCGPRPIDEFVQLGAAAPERPIPDSGVAAFVEYVYMRENPAGRHSEIFQHAGGCRAILVVERDTVTHAINSVRSAGVAA